MLTSTKTKLIPNGSTTAIDIEHGFTVVPALVLGFWVGSAAGASNGDARFGMFATDGVRHYSSSNTEDDANTTGSPAATTARDSGVLVASQDPAGNTIDGQLDFTSLDATKLRVTPSDAFPADVWLTLVFIAGVSAYVDAFTPPATAADISRTPWTGVTPDWGIMIFGLTGATMNANGGRAHLSIGCFTSAANQWVAWKGHEEATSNYTFDAFKTGSCGLASINGTAFADDLAFLNFQSGGGVIDRVVGSAARPMCVVWGKGGLPVVGTFALRTTTGTIAVSTSGHASSCLLAAANPPATATETAPAEPGEMMIGVAAGASDRRAMWMLNHNAEPISGGSPTDVLAYHTDNKFLERRTRTGTDTTTQAALVDVQSVVQGTVTLDQTVTDGVAHLVGYFSLGDPPGDPSVLRRRTLASRIWRWFSEPHQEEVEPNVGVYAGPFVPLSGGATTQISAAERRSRLLLFRRRLREAEPDAERYIEGGMLEPPYIPLGGGQIIIPPGPPPPPLAGYRVDRRDPKKRERPT